MICNAPRSESSLLANPTATKANGNRVSNRPPTAPQAANRGSDNSSNLRRRPAIPSTIEKSAPPTKPGIASAVLTVVLTVVLNYGAVVKLKVKLPVNPLPATSFAPVVTVTV